MFKLDEFMGRRVLKSSLLDGEDVVAFFTTRDLPLKSGECEDLIEEVENNKKLICEGLDIPLENLIIPIQTHSDNIGIIRCKDAKTHRGIENCSPIHPFSFSTYENTDALITDQPQIALALNFADCVPIVLFDPIKKVIAIAHAGWRGTVAKIGPKTVERMIENFGSKPEDIIALIGPAIGKCCFEVKEDVKKKLVESIDDVGLVSPTYLEAWQNKSQTSKPLNLQSSKVDLKLINKIQLLASGVKKIDLSEDCTSCQSELFFSYRKEKGKTARHSAVIMLRGKM